MFWYREPAPSGRRRGGWLVLGLAGWLGLAGSGCATAGNGEADWPRYELRADRWWLLNLPEGQRLDASALLRLPSGELWTINDQRPAVFRITLSTTTNTADLQPVDGLLTREQLAGLTRGRPGLRFDGEGLAADDQGRIYLSEEGQRWILRWDPRTQALTRLEIDWGPVAHFFHGTDYNASFEGVAVDGPRLYVANERQVGRILVVDLTTLQVIDHFTVAPAGSDSDDTHFTDLAWTEGSLWALLRDVRKVLRVDPATRRVLAEFDYAAMEMAAEVAYGALYAPGFMEGLAVDDTHLWLLIDNNGVGRRANARDTRPTLFRCPRPDRVAPSGD